jgi:hypothetical protein
MSSVPPAITSIPLHSSLSSASPAVGIAGYSSNNPSEDNIATSTTSNASANVAAMPLPYSTSLIILSSSSSIIPTESLGPVGAGRVGDVGYKLGGSGIAVIVVLAILCASFRPILSSLLTQNSSFLIVIFFLNICCWCSQRRRNAHIKSDDEAQAGTTNSNHNLNCDRLHRWSHMTDPLPSRSSGADFHAGSTQRRKVPKAIISVSTFFHTYFGKLFKMARQSKQENARQRWEVRRRPVISSPFGARMNDGSEIDTRGMQSTNREPEEKPTKGL